MPPSAFLSFSSQDRELAQEIYQGLLGRGIEVWKAPENIPPGMDWAAAIHAAIAQQQVFLLLWSDAAMASAEVSKEIRLAASQARSLLLPVRLTAAMPHGTQDYHLGGIQWLEGQGLPLPDLLDRIEARIRDLVESGQHSAAPSAKTARARGSAWRQRVLQGLVGVAALAAVAFDLNPWLPPNQWLLDQRLFWQARWRQLTDQLGPTPEPLGLVLLSSPLYGQLGVEPTDGSVNQAVLAKVLQALPNNSAQLVGLDFILDGPGANPAGHRSLAAVIKQQPASRQIVAGLCPPNAVAVPNCLKALDQRLAGSLATAGARPVSITLGMRTEDLPPLQLIEPIGEGSFAWAMAADAPRGGLPTEAVIDWSVNWLASQRLQLIRDRQALQQFKGLSLIVASDGYKGAPAEPTRRSAPGAAGGMGLRRTGHNPVLHPAEQGAAGGGRAGRASPIDQKWPLAGAAASFRPQRECGSSGAAGLVGRGLEVAAPLAGAGGSSGCGCLQPAGAAAAGEPATITAAGATSGCGGGDDGRKKIQQAEAMKRPAIQAALIMALLSCSQAMAPVWANPSSAPPAGLMTRIRQFLGVQPRSVSVGGTRSNAAQAVCLLSPGPIELRPDGPTVRVVDPQPALVLGSPLNEIELRRGEAVLWSKLASSKKAISGRLAWPLAPLKPGERLELAMRPRGAAGGDWAVVSLQAASAEDQQRYAAANYWPVPAMGSCSCSSWIRRQRLEMGRWPRPCCGRLALIQQRPGGIAAGAAGQLRKPRQTGEVNGRAAPWRSAVVSDRGWGAVGTGLGEWS